MTRMDVLVRTGVANVAGPADSVTLAAVPARTQHLLLRMFADPFLVEPGERADLVAELRAWAARSPDVAEVRVLLGMALCVKLEAHAAIEELSHAVRLDPDSFIAQLKLGELWMRLRVCDKAEHHTRRAALLARTPAQSHLARVQAASIRTMQREGIERGGYVSPWRWLAQLRRLKTRLRGRDETLAVADAG